MMNTSCYTIHVKLKNKIDPKSMEQNLRLITDLDKMKVIPRVDKLELYEFKDKTHALKYALVETCINLMAIHGIVVQDAIEDAEKELKAKTVDLLVQQLDMLLVMIKG